MAGIYIHIPFCKTRCIYCDFFTQTDMSLRSRYVDAVCRELELYSDYLGREFVKTIYLGGGTPSQLTAQNYDKIFEAIHNNFAVLPDAEITVEANPDDLDVEYIGELISLPFNRISIGVQSFDDAQLAFLNRRHSAERAKTVVEWCQQAGFNNISIDLMYGLPGQTMMSWFETLNTAISLNVQHISSYHLIYEEGTQLNRLLEDGKIKSVDEDLSADLFLLLQTKLTSAGFIHYEISNFAKEGFFSRHNSSYWLGAPYLGIGSSAHSYNGKSRKWNISSVGKYIQGIEEGQPLSETEYLSENMLYNDFIITRMRTIWGVDLEELERRFGKDKLEYCLRNIAKHINNKTVEKRNNTLIITERGMLVSDGIMSDLMYID